MADLHPFRLGTLPATEEGRSTLRAVSTSVADAQFSAWAAAIAAGCAGRAGASASDPSQHQAAAKLPAAQAQAGARLLSALLLDWAKCGAPASAVRTAAEEYGLSPAKAGAFADVYAGALEEIRAALSAAGESRRRRERVPARVLPLSLTMRTHSSPPLHAGIPLPQLLDLSWRLDYLVSTKEAGRIGKPVYHVTLTLLDLGEGGEGGAGAGAGAGAAAAAADGRRTVTFACSPQELEDLQGKLREAVRAAQLLLQPRGPGGGGRGT
jgi:hypothetical protein